MSVSGRGLEREENRSFTRSRAVPHFIRRKPVPHLSPSSSLPPHTFNMSHSPKSHNQHSANVAEDTHDWASTAATVKPLSSMTELELGIQRSRIGAGDIGHQAVVIDKGGRGFYGHVGNPGLVGLAAHAVTLSCLASSFMGWRGVNSPTLYVGNLFFFAGLYMFVAYQWCLVK